jgi:hypothetical protein
MTRLKRIRYWLVGWLVGDVTTLVVSVHNDSVSDEWT